MTHFLRNSLFISFLTVFLMLPLTALATNGYQLIGVGSYQKSLGGAVTANPGTAMTAITNPAGMIRIGKRADFSMEAFMPTRSTDFTAYGGDRVESDSDLYGVPAIGWTAPIGDRDDLYFGGGMYGTSGLGVDYAETLMMPAAASFTGNDLVWDGYSNIAFWQMAPTIAWDANDRLSLGAALNIDYQQVSFSQRMRDTVSGALYNFDLNRSANAFGFGLSLGLLYDFSESFTVGFSYKSKQFFTDLEYNLRDGDIDTTLVGGPSFPGGKYTLDLDFPQQLALGIALRPSDRWTISADLKWIEWSDTMGELKVEGPSGYDFAMDPGWDDQVVYAVGVDFQVLDAMNLRFGFNYAESPIDGSNAANNLILPGVVEDHYTFGLDYRFSHWALGFHYMYAPEVMVRAETGFPGTAIRLEETSLGVNLGYRWD
ncbi:MAG: outer membrane protein transport protein [Xanthomonadales bacterium]|jgi:long-chain fatty acid transport protein|nr:outer membrane protein transport protein [Xanthomonadales bacterium]